ncbi:MULTISPECIES: AMP-binding protein [unclassified Paenibacillus]|uniref:phenylacetate--CoA ligase family protein n=1 Tax=unclassified Paenibacillus TaxID=185978 RepID=UPI001AE7BB30|nr:MULTISPECIES: AMP-binding protein [unclassified Paenibacillus]MBP1155735.1 phenylacetate-CoA ligase [Paenibacillus sp. PvP091]MBP1168879.1 phenylacetate-CoA ligase [Paenibacillus sp. PvR098]MBP2439907.1 phenylacetate-CoA ligase [Paenibacillus sp. PvP052]
MDRTYWAPDMETSVPGSLHSLEESRLRQQLSWVLKHSPLYQEKFKGIDPEKFQLSDLSKLPVTTKQEVRLSQELYPPLGGHACVDWRQIGRIHASSGTTGRPTLVGASTRDREMWRDLVARCMWAMGCRPEHRAWVPLTFGWWIAGLSFYEGLQHLGAAVLPSGNNEPARTLGVLQTTGADFAISTPSFITYLAQLAQDELGMDPRSLGLKNIGLGGEPGAGLPDVRRQIQETWGAKVYDCMGTADFCTVIWSECECQDGMHFFGQGYIIPELLDPVTGDVIEVKKGVVGELLYTAIHRECTPLMRFKIGDLVEVVGDGTCDCGRTGMRIRCVGRADDMLIIQGVNVYPSAVADVVSSFRPRTTGEIRIFTDGAGPNVQPPVRIQVEHEPDVGDLEALKHDIELAVRQKLVFRANIEWVDKGALAAKGGMKRNLVERPKVSSQ